MYVSNWGEEDDVDIDVDEPVPVARTPAPRGVATYGLDVSDDEDEEDEDAIPTQPMSDTSLPRAVGPVRTSTATFGIIDDDEDEEDDPEEETPFQRKAEQVRGPGPWACSLWQGLAC